MVKWWSVLDLAVIRLWVPAPCTAVHLQPACVIVEPCTSICQAVTAWWQQCSSTAGCLANLLLAARKFACGLAACMLVRHTRAHLLPSACRRPAAEPGRDRAAAGQPGGRAAGGAPRLDTAGRSQCGAGRPGKCGPLSMHCLGAASVDFWARWHLGCLVKLCSPANRYHLHLLMSWAITWCIRATMENKQIVHSPLCIPCSSAARARMRRAEAKLIAENSMVVYAKALH